MLKKQFDIYEYLAKRPLSWSALSSFTYDKERWYRNYVLGERESPSRQMLFGSKIGKRIEKESHFLPLIPRHSKMEYKFMTTIVTKEGKKIPLVGYADTFCDRTNRQLGEYKTGIPVWDQTRVDLHGQIDMYCLMNYLMNKVKPEEMVSIQLVWMPTKENEDFSISFIEPINDNIKIFKTKRTMVQMLKFQKYITKTVDDMEKYVRNHA